MHVVTLLLPVFVQGRATPYPRRATFTGWVRPVAISFAPRRSSSLPSFLPNSLSPFDRPESPRRHPTRATGPRRSVMCFSAPTFPRLALASSRDTRASFFLQPRVTQKRGSSGNGVFLRLPSGFSTRRGVEFRGARSPRANAKPAEPALPLGKDLGGFCDAPGDRRDR